jgi:hypothetical protein
MSLRSFLYLAVTGCLLTLLLAFTALMPKWQGHAPQSILSYNDVRGMAVESQGLLYTLNFDQQNRVVAAINNGEPLPAMDICAPSMDKLVLYRFNVAPLELTR